MTDYHEGPAQTYVPIVKHPRDFMFSFGPLGYERVEEVTECPIRVKTDQHKPERT